MQGDAAPDRWLVGRWPIIIGLLLLGINWGVQTTTTSGLSQDVNTLDQRADRIDALLADHGRAIAGQAQQANTLNDRFTAQANRINQHDLQFADLNRAAATNAQLIATLTERIAGQASADSPRLRQIEQALARLEGQVEEHARSLEAIRQLLVAEARTKPLRGGE